MQAVHIAAAQIEAGMGDAFLCVGVESMTMVPQGGFNFSPNPELKESTSAYVPMGQTAENVAQHWNVSREDQDRLALQSHQKAASAHPLGATGARITGKAASLLARQQGHYALSTQCIGGGQGIATVLERP